MTKKSPTISYGKVTPKKHKAKKAFHPNLTKFEGDECKNRIKKDNTISSYSYEDKQRAEYGNVSHEFLEMIARKFVVPIHYDAKGNKLEQPTTRSMWNNDGTLNVELALAVMGFATDPETGRLDYSILSGFDGNGEKGVIIRDNKNPYIVRKQKVYSGRIRSTFQAKEIYEKYDILTGDFDTGLSPLQNILEIGDEENYRKGSASRIMNMRVMSGDDEGTEE